MRERVRVNERETGEGGGGNRKSKLERESARAQERGGERERASERESERERERERRERQRESSHPMGVKIKKRTSEMPKTRRVRLCGRTSTRILGGPVKGPSGPGAKALEPEQLASVFVLLYQ